MAYRYKLIDTKHPTWSSGKFNSLPHALRELKAGNEVAPGRFKLVDRTTGEEVS